MELRLPGDPVTVVGRVLRASREQDTETFVGLFAADGYIEGPYRPKGVPGRVTGRDRIREFLTAQADAPWPGPPEMIARLAVHLHSVTLTDVILRLVYGATPRRRAGLSIVCADRPPGRSDRRISQSSPRSSAEPASRVREHRRHDDD